MNAHRYAKKLASQFSSVLTYCRFNIGNYFRHAQVGVPDYTVWTKAHTCIYVCPSTSKKKQIHNLCSFLRYIANFLFSTTLGMPDHSSLK